MERLNDNLLILARKITPSQEQIKEADSIYNKVVVALLSSNVITKDSMVIKQGSYKNRTLTITNHNKEIDLDILVEGDYDHPDKAKSAILSSLRAAGFQCESKTRVVRATMGGFSIDILPVTKGYDDFFPFYNLFRVREKGTSRTKTIDPIGLHKWMKTKKFDHYDFANKRDIDKEKYNVEASNLSINLSIRILKAFAYEYKERSGQKIPSYVIELLATSSYYGQQDIQTIISDALKGMEKFANDGDNFKNPNYNKETLIIHEDKRTILDFVHYAKTKLNELKPSSTRKNVTVAGVTVIIPAVVSPAFASKTLPPHHGRDFLKEMGRLRDVKVAKLNGMANNDKIITYTSGSNEKYDFKFGRDEKGRISLFPLFKVKDRVHVYPDGSICLFDKKVISPSKKRIEASIECWLNAYEVYLQFGFWGYSETGHEYRTKFKEHKLCPQQQ